MAEVYLADEVRPVGEPRRVVLKRLLPEVASQPSALRMFRAEGQLGRYLKHDNLIDVHEAGNAKDASGIDRSYLTMEYVRGIDLWQLNRWIMQRGEVLPISIALGIGDAILRGLSFAHEAVDENGNALRIIHRDVSPSNVLLSHHGEVKLGDFGIAQSSLRNGDDNFDEERAKGKLGYLAPEQVRGEACSQATDIFSTAVIIAECLIGRPLFVGESELAILLAIRDAQISTFTDMLGHLPPGLGETVIGALQASPQDRIQSAREFADALLAYQKEKDATVYEELGALVAKVIRAAKEPREVRRSSQEEVERVTKMTDLGGLRLPGTLRPPATPVLKVNSVPVDRAPITELETVLYHVSNAGQGNEDLSYAEVVERIHDGRIVETDMISKNGGVLVEASQLPELSRHLAGGLSTTREVMRTSESDLIRSLSDGAIVGLLCEAAHKKQTGLWIFRNDGMRKELYLENGKPRFVTSNVKREMLGEYLVSARVIARSELDMALAVMPRYQGRLGDTLTALGLVEPVQLFQHIEEQVREKLLQVFTWTQGEASYYAGVEPPQSAFPLELEPWELIGEGCRLRVRKGLEDHRFEGKESASLVLREDYDPALLFETLPLEAQVLLMTIERPRRFDDIDSASSAEQQAAIEARAAVVFLIELGVARWA